MSDQLPFIPHAGKSAGKWQLKIHRRAARYEQQAVTEQNLPATSNHRSPGRHLCATGQTLLRRLKLQLQVLFPRSVWVRCRGACHMWRTKVEPNLLTHILCQCVNVAQQLKNNSLHFCLHIMERTVLKLVKKTITIFHSYSAALPV